MLVTLIHIKRIDSVAKISNFRLASRSRRTKIKETLFFQVTGRLKTPSSINHLTKTLTKIQQAPPHPLEHQLESVLIFSWVVQFYQGLAAGVPHRIHFPMVQQFHAQFASP